VTAALVLWHCQWWYSTSGAGAALVVVVPSPGTLLPSGV